MESMWGKPESHADEAEFFTDFYHDVEWLFDHHHATTTNDDFFERCRQLELCPSDIKKARKYFKKSGLEIPRPESIDIILQGRNPQIYPHSRGACVMITMRSGNTTTMYGLERSSDRPVRAIKAQWRATGLHYVEHQKLSDPANWHHEDFDQHQLHPYEQQVLHGLMKSLA